MVGALGSGWACVVGGGIGGGSVCELCGGDGGGEGGNSCECGAQGVLGVLETAGGVVVWGSSGVRVV